MFGGVGAVESIGTISQIEGSVYVSAGARYVSAPEGTGLKEGDRVFVMENRSAIISFNDGCGYGLTDSKILEVGSVSPCAAGEGGSYRIDPYSGISQDPKVAATAYKQVQALGGTAGGFSAAPGASAAV